MTVSKSIIYLSHVLNEDVIGYAGKKGLSVKKVLSIDLGNACNQSEWTLSNHIGTHIDAPYHFDNYGLKIDQFPAHFWIFDKVAIIDIDIKIGTLIMPDKWCEKINQNVDLLLIRTHFEKFRNSEDYWSHNPGISIELARWIKSNRPNIRVIGMDFISVTSFDHRDIGKEVHRILLGNSISNAVLLVEDMKLGELSSNPKQVIISPLRVQNSDGSPITAIAIL